MKYPLALASLLFSSLSLAQTITFTTTPATGVSPLSVTHTWSTTNAASCVASGGWSGAKALSGTETTANVSVNTSFTLTCTAGSGTAVLTWTPPTTNTDGSPLTNLTNYQIFRSTSSTTVGAATPIEIAAPSTTYTMTGIPAGTWYFGMKAKRSDLVTSDLSNIATKTIVLASATKTNVVTVTSKPNPPVLVTVEQTAYEVKSGWFGQSLGRVVGNIPLGVPCYQQVLTSGGRAYYSVPVDQVQLTRTPKSQTLVSRCAAIG